MDPALPTAEPRARERRVTTSGAAVRVVTTRRQFVELARDWNALVDRTDAPLFYRHGFIRLWLAHFGTGQPLRLLTSTNADGRLDAALPLLARHSRWYGLPVRELVAPANDHSCRFDLLADNPRQAARQFVETLAARDDWDMLRLVDVPPDAHADALLQAAGEAGLAVGEWPSIASPYLPLPATFDELADGLTAKFRANLRRRRRRLEQTGRVTVERIDGGDLLDARLDEGLALEASGWKGRAGTAIVQDPQTQGFYRALAHHSARKGRLALWFLRLDGRAIAFHYALEDRGRLLLLKPAYDESCANFSPGHLLLEHALRDAVERGLQEFDFLGADMPWKRDWTALTRQHRWLFLFRGMRGRLLHGMKFQLAPTLRRLVQPAPASTTR